RTSRQGSGGGPAGNHDIDRLRNDKSLFQNVAASWQLAPHLEWRPGLAIAFGWGHPARSQAMGRSLVVAILLGAVLVSGCASPRPDPALLDMGPEAFLSPPDRPGEPVKEEPDRRAVEWARVGTEIALNVVILAAYVALLGLSHNWGGDHPPLHW